MRLPHNFTETFSFHLETDLSKLEDILQKQLYYLVLTEYAWGYLKAFQE